MTLKGQGQNDPWLTIEGTDVDDFRAKLDSVADVFPLIAEDAADYVKALNSQPGISIQRDQKAAQPAAAAPAQPFQRPAPAGPRPSLSSSLKPEADENYYIELPYQRNAATRDRQKELAKSLGARYKPEEALAAGVPANAKGQPVRPWCVHTGYVSGENVAELLRLHETKFAGV